MTDNTKLPDTVLYLCKPLIQVLGDGNVAFVHFTMQEYLISSLFVKQVEAERTATLSCMSYLGFAFRLVDPAVQDEERTIGVAKGFHSLQTYANEHWREHLLAYATQNNGIGSIESPMSDC
ncbi:hypothetical protein BCR34DRAFT_277213 [Clohesyomyces aquaticus]|uniref:Uncharacterized protein n=1 Tax=Clohesyomyces aquaticus TaxID=1231657 RepID=A0A1Y1ZRZ8_9PLEO|nr:hypothetical protein BCR34DRAFT_277213 [Clohesyomyces aquaticus]